MNTLEALAELIQTQNESILAEWRQAILAEWRQAIGVDTPAGANLDRGTIEDGIRHFMDELSNALIETFNTGRLPTGMDVGPAEHGLQRFGLGFDIDQLVMEFSMLRAAIMHACEQHGIVLEGFPRLALHQIIDRAMASAVRSFSEAQRAEFDRRVQERLAMVVHDLKTPLSSAQTAFHLLEARLSAETKQGLSVMLGIIFRNCDNLNKMLMKLLERTSRDQMVLHSELSRSEYELRLLVAEVIANVQPLADKTGVPVINEVPDRLTVDVDAFLFRQVIQNLLSNALKYTATGQVTLEAFREEAQVIFSVADTGIGMPPEKLAILFARHDADPLQRESSGMGLSIVKRIVDAHRAQIRVESEPGKGTRFVVILPQPY